MNKVYQIVTERMIAIIEEAIKNGDVLPWQKPWNVNSIARNWVSQKPYRGINIFLLRGGEWLTWNQICDEQKKNPKVHLKKGSKASLVVYFNFKDRTDEETGEVERIPFLRYYNVYNIADVEGLEAKHAPVTYEHDPIEEAERMSNDYLDREKIKLNIHEIDRAFYSPGMDEITIPPMERFKEISEYYSTLFHEMTHSTGHSKRLNRLTATAHFGDKNYSKEELVAEMGAAMLCGRIGIENKTVDNSAAYLRSWIKALKDDTTMLVSAAGKAQKAVDFIMGGEDE